MLMRTVVRGICIAVIAVISLQNSATASVLEDPQCEYVCGQTSEESWCEYSDCEDFEMNTTCFFDAGALGGAYDWCMEFCDTYPQCQITYCDWPNPGPEGPYGYCVAGPLY